MSSMKLTDFFKNEQQITSKKLQIEKVSAKEIAIIGLSVKFANGENIDELWQTLEKGVDCIRDFPEGRKKDFEDYYRYIGRRLPEGYNKAAYLENIDKFDYGFFGISPKEANLMDPNQRLFLETAWQAIEDSGYIESIRGKRVGVFLGCSGENEYKNVVSDVEPDFASMAVPGNCPSVIASRISYLLDLKGPNMIVNTVCSSSLVAVNLACRSIRNFDSEMAIAGGIQIYFKPAKDVKTGIESSDQKTRTFDDSSDGTGTGEGVVALLLKPLSTAIQDGDNIHGIIKGSFVNQDGNSLGLTAPNPEAQEDVLIKAWKDAGIDPMTLGYIEAHGTGTKLGDPIEIEGLTRAFNRYTEKKQFCPIGSIKTNMGHLDSAAGIMGLVKVVLSLQNKRIPPMLHFKKPNRQINFKKSPVIVNETLSNWNESGYPRRGGVSSFGFSGTNCHVVLEEAPAAFSNIEDKNKGLKVLTITAKSRESFNNLIKKYAQYLKKHPDISLDDLCYTSNIGRGHYNYRLALILKNLDDLIQAFSLLEKRELKIGAQNNIHFGVFKTEEKDILQKEGNEVSEAQIEEMSEKATALFKKFCSSGKENRPELEKVLTLYTKGAHINWNSLYSEEKRKKIGLPLYPFVRNRCWVNMGNQSSEIIESKRKTSDSLPIKIVTKENTALSPESKQLAIIIGSVLGYEELNLESNFLQVGGDSIQAMNIINAVNKEFETNAGMEMFLNAATLSDFINNFNQKYLNEKISVTSCGPIVKGKMQKYYPLSSAQKRIYVASRMFEKNTQYNIASKTQIEGPLDVGKLKEAISSLIKRHHSLRTSFDQIDNKPVQIVQNDAVIDFVYIEKPDSTIEQLFQDFIQPFDLHTAPLFRNCLVKTGTDKYLLLTDMHHIITDGASINIITSELLDLYQGKELDSLQIQYKDFALWQDELFRKGYLKKQEEYWLEQFKTPFSPLELPIDYRKSGKSLSNRGGTLIFQVGEDTTNILKKLVSETKTTLFILLYTAFTVLLHRYTGKEDIVVGTVISGRSRPELEHMIGMFINTLAIRNFIEGNNTFEEVLETIKNNALNAFKNQDYPYEDLVEKLRVSQKDTKSLLDTMFIMQEGIQSEYTTDKLTIKPCTIEESTSKFTLLLNAYESNGILHFSLNYNKDLFKEETILKYSKDYLKVLSAIAEDNTVRVKDICFDNINFTPRRINSIDVNFNLPGF